MNKEDFEEPKILIYLLIAPPISVYNSSSTFFFQSRHS